MQTIDFNLTEREIKHLLGMPSRSGFKLSARGILKYFLFFVLIFSLSFAVINAPSLYLRLKYFWKVDYLNQPILETKNKNTGLPKSADDKTATLDDNTLEIPKIGVFAPIVWNVKENEVLDKLREGVAHLQGSALPDSSSNVFITGHSSNYWWDKGKYKQVFALLDKLVAGDEIKVSYQNKIYLYKVRDVKVVKPSQVEVLNPTSTPTLTLMTCTPVGTTLNRLIVTTQLANPDLPGSTKSSAPVPELPFIQVR